ncbi:MULTISPECIES: alpha/beta hydrolase [unclassified Haladaptatus]|uniref:alpha/beta fold hydrolase n=1 Tax=unclassified Haladaptatus TaxID=2622732 RepID=UPI00209C1D6A|nr:MULTISPECIES: alpha/beta hydrolase [unclassified Haladaptatus]MCO8246105.1 alpha/beta hydrolase [Haladaptatus sp. AB643]MCO8254275.1 alpha/beta hydrolase [Haladaptatus sp. AB618]
MNLRRLAAATAGGVGLTAALNRSLAGSAEPLDPPLEGFQGTYRWRGFDVAYTEAGDPDNPDVLFLHGIHAAASNKEFDQIFRQLAQQYHVIAPDLPGFGRSSRPPVVYTASLYTSFVVDFAEDMTDNAICLASSLSGAYATLTQVETGAFSQLELICPTDDAGKRRKWLRNLVRSPLLGTALFNAIASKRSIRRFNERDGYFSEASYTEKDVEFEWQTAHQPGARFAPASFISGYLNPDEDLGEELARVDVPVTLVWGREAKVTPLEGGKELADEADTRLVVFDEARLLPHVEHPGPFLDVLFDELAPLEQQ